MPPAPRSLPDASGAKAPKAAKAQRDKLPGKRDVKPQWHPKRAAQLPFWKAKTLEAVKFISPTSPAGFSIQGPAAVPIMRTAAAGYMIASNCLRLRRKASAGCHRPAPTGWLPRAAILPGGIRSSQDRRQACMRRGFPCKGVSGCRKKRSGLPIIRTISWIGQEKCREPPRQKPAKPPAERKASRHAPPRF